MHISAYQNCLTFYKDFCKDYTEKLKVVDFGSYDVNGSLKSIFKSHEYIGIDMASGPNVDIVCTSDTTPFEDNSIDVIVSSSNFEHDDFFWMTFLEMCRIVKPGGLIYINAPSAGPYHGYPGDSWRFYADSWKSLVKWADKHEHTVQLVKSYIDTSEQWRDNIGIFRKIIS
jgi:predicted SAM-dependent methyltransferase